MKKVFALVLTLTLVASLVGCSNSGAESSTQTAPDATSDASTATPDQTWEIAASTPHNENTALGKSLAYFADEVYERTNGAVTVNQFYSSSYGAQKDVFMMMNNNEVEMIVDGTVVIDFYAPEYGFLTAPYMVTSVDHLNNLMASDLMDGFYADLSENNIYMAGMSIRGLRHTLSNVRIDDLTQANELVIRMPDNATFIEAWDALGASVQVIGGGDVYSSLSTGIVNSCEAPYEQAVADKYYEVTKYIYPTSHVVEFQAAYFSETWINELPEDIRAIVLETAEDAMAFATETAAAEADAHLQTMVDAGLEVIDVDTQLGFDLLADTWSQAFESGDWTSSYEEVMSYAN